MRIKRIPSSEVPRELVQVARTSARDAGFDLGLGNIQVVWFRPYPGEETAGFFDEYFPNVIHLSADWAKRNGSQQVKAACYHEARHDWQIRPERHGRFTGYGMAGKCEDDANAYAYRKTGVVLNVANWFDNKQNYK